MVELTFDRTYAAPRQLVWDAWTDPDQMAQWWGPAGITTPRDSISIDLRPGGRINFVMVDDATGKRYTNGGTFQLVDPPQTLVWDDDGFPDGTGKSTATITFRELTPHSTALTVHLVADFSDTVRAGAQQGWGTQLDKLDTYLAD